MQDFRGKVAVVTGGASGIGNAVATRLGQEGMKLVLADIDAPGLDAAVAKLRAADTDVTGVVADVSKLESIEELCEKAHAAYGKVNVLHNNAGVLGPLAVPVWETTERDWEWMMGVNFWSVVHGIRVFVPRMLAHGEEGHVVNTASSAGIAHSSTIYGVTKHAVVSVSEYLYFNLRQANAKIGVTALCPGVLATNLPANSPRVRPEGLRNESAPSEIEQQRQAGFADSLARGKPPELAADVVFEAIRDQRFWVTTDSDWDERFSSRFESILQRRNPESPIPVRQSAT